MPVSNEGYPKALVTASNYFVKQGKNQTMIQAGFFLEKVNATIPKSFVGGFVFTVLSNNCTRGHGRMFAIAKGKRQMYVPQLQYQEQGIDHIHNAFRDCRVIFFCRQPFLK